MNGDKVFLDTNIIVYAYDKSAGEKHKVASDIIVALWNAGVGVISTQVLQEFFVIVTGKVPKPLKAHVAREIINDLLKWEVVVNDGVSILSAIDIQLEYKYSFRDSMIIDAAIKGGASILYSEDLSDGQVIKGITIKNPFKER